MRTHFTPLRFFTGTLCLLALTSVSHAAPLTSWLRAAGTDSSQLNTDSPVFNSQTQAIYASSTPYTLAVGDTLRLTGGVVFSGLSTTSTADQFRFGIYDSNGQTGSLGWLGYFAANAGPSGGPTNSRLWERLNPSPGANFYQNGPTQATQIATTNASPANTAFASGSYTFSLAYTRTATGINIAWTLASTNVSYSLSSSFTDTTPQTYTFDRVGIAGLSLGASAQTSFSNLDLTYTPVPEPAALSLLAVAGVLIVALRRRKTRLA